MMSPEQFAAEFECDPSAAIQGAYYGKELVVAEAEDRITDVPYEVALPVHTAWDLGIGDSTAIWFWQAAGNEVRVIDYYENHGKALPHYVSELEARQGKWGYRYGKDFLPHDAKVKELGTGKTRVETLSGLGRKVSLIPNAKIIDGINAARQLLPKCWFDGRMASRHSGNINAHGMTKSAVLLKRRTMTGQAIARTPFGIWRWRTRIWPSGRRLTRIIRGRCLSRLPS
jgi:phage terminase large subunit